MQRFLKLLFICVLIGSFLQGRAQLDPPKLNNLIKPSPEAAGMTRYAIYPVSYSTGTPNISIPLYTVQVKNLSLPVSIDYNTSGVKVSDVSSYVGLSWNLSGIGTITRVIVGRPDEDPSRGVLAIGIPNVSELDYRYCYDATRQDLDRIDTEPDLFYYNFGGHSGKFYFGKTKNEIISVPYTDLRITFDNGFFTVVDTNGNTYFFNQTSSSLTKTNGPYDGGVTGWYLTRVLMNNGIDEILFTYDRYSNGVMSSYAYSTIVGGVPKLSCGPSTCSINLNFESNSSITRTDQLYDNVYVRDITFPGGKMEFRTDSDRLDYGARILKEVKVSNTEGRVIKHFQFRQSYFVANPAGYNIYATSQDKYRLRLDALDEIEPTQTLTHRFEYNQTQLPPRLNCGVDYWGYYNGRTGNKTLMSDLDGGTTNNVYYAHDNRTYPLDVTVQDLANRQPDEKYMMAGMLNRIYYPAGGYTEFQFEPHRFITEKTVTNPGELRMAIAKISDSPNDPSRVSEFVATTTTVTLNLSIPLDDIHRPYATFEDLTTATSPGKFSTFPGESPQRTITVSTIKGHTYRITANISPDPQNPDEDPDLKTVVISAYWSDGSTSVIQIPKQEGGLRVKSISNFDTDGARLSKQSFQYGENEEGYGRLSFFPYLFTKRTYEQNYYFSFMLLPQSECVPVATKRMSIMSEPLFSPSDIGGSKIFYTKVTRYEEGSSGTNNGKTEYTFEFEMDNAVDYSYPDPVLLVSESWKSGMPSSERYFRYAGNQFRLIKETKNEYRLFEKATYHGLKIGHIMVSVPQGCDALYYGETRQYYYDFDYPITSGIKKLIRRTETSFDEDGSVPQLIVDKRYHYDNTSHLQPTRIESWNSKGENINIINRYPQDKAFIVGLDDDAVTAIDRLVSTNRILDLVEQELYTGTTFTSRERTLYKVWSPRIVAPTSIQFQQGAGPLEDRIQFHRYDLAGNVLEQSRANDIHNAYLWGYNYQYPIAEVKNATYQQLLDVLGQTIVNNLNDNPGTDEQMHQALQPLRVHRTLRNANINTYAYERIVGLTSASDVNDVRKYFEYNYGRLALVWDGQRNILARYRYGFKKPGIEAQDQNYISSEIIQVGKVTETSAAEALPLYTRLQTNKFYDGLGRLKQVVETQRSPGRNDIVTPTLYDAFEREATKYLPYVSTEANGWIKMNALGATSTDYMSSPQYSFYNNGNKQIANDTKPYTTTVYEASPLNRVERQGSAGSVWQPTEQVDSDRSVKFNYEFNKGSDVILFEYDPTTKKVNYTEGESLKFYDPNMLYVNRTTDEDNNEVIEYINKGMKTILKKVLYKQQLNDKYYAKTYYVYDDEGNLVLVLSPEAVAELEISSTRGD